MATAMARIRKGYKEYKEYKEYKDWLMKGKRFNKG